MLFHREVFRLKCFPISIIGPLPFTSTALILYIPPQCMPWVDCRVDINTHLFWTSGDSLIHVVIGCLDNIGTPAIFGVHHAKAFCPFAPRCQRVNLPQISVLVIYPGFTTPTLQAAAKKNSNPTNEIPCAHIRQWFPSTDWLPIYEKFNRLPYLIIWDEADMVPLTHKTVRNYHRLSAISEDQVMTITITSTRRLPQNELNTSDSAASPIWLFPYFNTSWSRPQNGTRGRNYMSTIFVKAQFSFGIEFTSFMIRRSHSSSLIAIPILGTLGLRANIWVLYCHWIVISLEYLGTWQKACDQIVLSIWYPWTVISVPPKHLLALPIRMRRCSANICSCEPGAWFRPSWL